MSRPRARAHAIVRSTTSDKNIFTARDKRYQEHARSRQEQGAESRPLTGGGSSLQPVVRSAQYDRCRRDNKTSKPANALQNSIGAALH